MEKQLVVSSKKLQWGANKFVVENQDLYLRIAGVLTPVSAYTVSVESGVDGENSKLILEITLGDAVVQKKETKKFRVVEGHIPIVMEKTSVENVILDSETPTEEDLIKEAPTKKTTKKDGK